MFSFPLDLWNFSIQKSLKKTLENCILVLKLLYCEKLLVDHFYIVWAVWNSTHISNKIHDC